MNIKDTYKSHNKYASINADLLYARYITNEIIKERNHEN